MAYGEGFRPEFGSKVTPLLPNSTVWARANLRKGCSRIVGGAVGMFGMALNRLTENGVVTLDEDRKAAMVSTLMVVLCGDRPPSPIVNAGSLYA
jgi:hypothetical protein